MNEPNLEHLKKISKHFDVLKLSLSSLIKEEKGIITKEHFLKEKGFLIKKYELILDKIDIVILEDIKDKISKVLEIEEYLMDELKKYKKEIKRMDNAYLEIEHKKLNLKKHLLNLANNTFHTLKISKVRIDELVKLVQEGKKFHKKTLDPKSTKVIFGLEKSLDQAMVFLQFIDQLVVKLNVGSVDLFFNEYKEYGRAMNVKEFKTTIKKKELSSPKDPTDAFDCPTHVYKKIKAMSSDQKKTFFGTIGVVGAVKVVFFKTKLKPINFDRPIPQTNGLRAYSFPKNTEIEIFDAA